jgi:organic hydroperoxide reductase OsmC/OhrA
MTSREHHFACRLTWTGAAKGPITSYDAYSRDFRIEMFGKSPLEGSAAPAFRGDARRHNPEDLLVAALSSCHCLSYLALAARAGIAVVAYGDEATGTMASVDGKIRFTEVTLHPRVWVRPGSDIDMAQALHRQAHEECFIASSVNFPVSHEAVTFERS